MAASLVYSAIFGAVIATMPAVDTPLVVFDTSVVDLTDQLDDPVDLLFSTQLGGGTDINRAVAYCQAISYARRTTIDLRADQRPVRGRRRGGVHEARGVTRGIGRPVHRAACVERRGRPAFQRASRRGAGDVGCAGLRLHARSASPDLMARAIQRQDPHSISCGALSSKSKFRSESSTFGGT